MAKPARAIRMLLLAWAVLAAGPAGAAPVTVMFSGTLDQVSDPGGLSGGSIGVGTMFSGTLRFDGMPPDEFLSSPAIGVFRFPAPMGSLMIGAENLAQSSGTRGIVIWIDAQPTAPGASTNLLVLAPSTRPLGPTRDETFFLDLGFVFPLPSGENVANFPFDISLFPWARAGFAVMGPGGSFNASGPVTRL